MKITKDTEIVEFIEKRTGHTLCPAYKTQLGGISMWTLHSHLAESAPRSVERNIPQLDGAWGMIDIIAETSALDGKDLVQRHGLAPRPDWFDPTQRSTTSPRRATSSGAELSLAEASARLFGESNAPDLDGDELDAIAERLGVATPGVKSASGSAIDAFVSGLTG